LTGRHAIAACFGFLVFVIFLGRFIGIVAFHSHSTWYFSDKYLKERYLWPARYGGAGVSGLAKFPAKCLLKRRIRVTHVGLHWRAGSRCKRARQNPQPCMTDV
jgi:hypothetical protein